MNVIQTGLPGLKVLEPKVFGDARDFFVETWNRARYVEAGLPGEFVQDNLSYYQRGVLRGLHFQYDNPQGKLVQVLEGVVWNVAVDIRRGSPTFGRWHGLELSADDKRQFWVPVGFAHGFCVISEIVLFACKYSDYFNPKVEPFVRWDDPDLALPWPVAKPSLSAEDQTGLRLAEIPAERLPVYEETP